MISSYFCHSMDLSRYSKYSPRVRIIMKEHDRTIRDIFEVGVSVTMGSRRVISTSKIRKIMDTRKNWTLKGSRLRACGSNPHSKGDDFSRLPSVFFERVEFIVSRRAGIRVISVKIISIDSIYLYFVL